MPDTPINLLLPFITALLGDRFGAGKKDVTLITAVRLAANMGQLGSLSLSEDANSLTPGITTPDQFTLATFCPALLLIQPDASSRGLRLRGMSQQFGDAQPLVQSMRRVILVARNGGSGRVMSSWSSFGGFCRGFAGLDDFAQAVTRLNVQAPFTSVTLAAGGTTAMQGGAYPAASGSGITPVIPSP